MPELKHKAWRLEWARTAVERLQSLLRRAARPARHVLAWALLMVAAAWFLEPLKSLDWYLVNRMDSGKTTWPARVEIVDLEWDMDPGGLEAFRGKLAGAMEALAALDPQPRMVVVDVRLSTVPLGLERLKSAVQRLHQRGIEVVGVVDLNPFFPGVNRDEGLRRQGRGAEIYDYKALFGHTYFEFKDNAYWYRPCLSVPSLKDEDCLRALPAVVGAKFNRPDIALPTLTPRDRPVMFQPGGRDLWKSHLWKLDRDGKLESSPPGRAEGSLAHAVVILGNPQTDVFNGRPGPEVLAWAIGAHISPSPPDAPRPVVLAELPWTLGFALGFSLIALAVFALIQRALAHPQRHLVALAVSSALLTLGGLLALVALMRLGMHVIFVPVSYVAVAVLLTIALAWHALRAALRERAMYTNVAGPDGSVEPNWDVFISYSHTPRENMDWVESELYVPLTKAVWGDRPLRVFFDKNSIRIGTNWYFTLAEDIERSRCVVAVYSSDYFSKNFCNFELGKAAVRDIAAKGKGTGFFILPVMRGQVPVPPAFSHLQFGMVTDPSALVGEVLKRLQARSAPPA
jgi:TIR domain